MRKHSKKNYVRNPILVIVSSSSPGYPRLKYPRLRKISKIYPRLRRIPETEAYIPRLRQNIPETEIPETETQSQNIPETSRQSRV